MLDKLVQFAKNNYPELKGSNEDALMGFFEFYSKTTLIRVDDAGNVDGFFVYENVSDKKVFFLACLKGDRVRNVQDMLKTFRSLKKEGPLTILLRRGKKCLRL